MLKNATFLSSYFADNQLFSNSETLVKYFVGAHCTGLNSTYSIRNFLGLTSESALVGSVGTVITAKGIFPGYME